MYLSPILEKQEFEEEFSSVFLEYKAYWLLCFRISVKGLFNCRINYKWVFVDDKSKNVNICEVDKELFIDGEPKTKKEDFSLNEGEAEKIAKSKILRNEIKMRLLIHVPEIQVLEKHQVYFPYWHGSKNNKTITINARTGERTTYST